jgi:lipoate-protein ligase A
MDLDRHLISVLPDEPIVRFYTWAGRVISLGCNQNPARRVKLGLCRENGIDVVRRPTGGREILHGDDICYSVIWPLRSSRRMEEAGRIFERVSYILTRGLKRLGVQAGCRRISRRRISGGPCFTLVDRGELTARGRKLVASAQRIYDHVVLQQGSMLLTRPSTDLSVYIRTDNRLAVSRRLEMTTTWLFRHVHETFPIPSIVERFREEFERFFESEPGFLDFSPDSRKVNTLQS